MTYQLDPHGEELLQEYRQNLPVLQRIEQIVYQKVSETLKEQGIYVTTLEHRIKTEQSLAGKLERKGGKYSSIADITDLFGMRIITFYNDDVDKVAAIVKGIFEVDWKNSVDKRKLHQLTSFGYNSLHYICRIPKSLVDDPTMPQLNTFRFEIQMRTALQHVWSTIEHDIGYKGAVQIPPEHRRQFSRLSGMLELIDDEFSRMRNTMTEYRRQMQSLVASGKLDEVPLTTDTFRQYLETKPFEALNSRIAAANQAEVFPAPLMPFLPILLDLKLETLGDVKNFIDENAEAAYQLALSNLAFTDLDIIAESVGLQNLCVVCALKQGRGRFGVKTIFDTLNGERDSNNAIADMVMAQAASLPFMNES